MDIIQRSFEGGEVPESFWHRTDLPQFNRSGRVMQNFIPLANGELVNRPGLKYVGEIPFDPLTTGTDRVRMYPLGQIGTVPDLALVWGYDASADRTIHAVSPGAVGAAATFAIGNLYDFVKTTGATWNGVLAWSGDISVRPALVSVNHMTLAITTTTFPDTISSAPAAPTSLTVSIAGAASIPVYYQVSSVDAVGRESLPTAIASDTGDALADSNPATISWVAATGASKYYVYRVEHGVSRFVGDTTGTSFVDYKFDRTDTLGPISAAWSFSIIPRPDWTSVAVHQQRLIGVESNIAQSPIVYASRVGNILSGYAGTPIADSDAYKSTLVDIGQIYFTRSIGGELMFFADTGVWVSRGDQTGSLTPAYSGASQQWYSPGANVPPIAWGGSVIYFTPTGQLRWLTRESAGTGYTTANLSDGAYPIDQYNYVTGGSYQSANGDHVWVHLSGGNRAWRCLTLDRARGVAAWSHHITDGEVVASCQSGSTMYFVVLRTIGVVKKYYLETLSDRVESRTTGVFLDSYVSRTASAGVISGLSHLEGKSVYVVGAGLKQGPFTVVSGSISGIDTTDTTSFVVGLPYVPLYTSQDVDAQGQQTGSLRPKNTGAVALRVRNTTGGLVSTNDGDWQAIRYRDEDMGYGPIPLFSGITEDILVGNGSDRETVVSIRQEDPFPMTITAIARSVK